MSKQDPNCDCPGCEANRLTERIIARAKLIEAAYRSDAPASVDEMNKLMALSLADHQQVAVLVDELADCMGAK